VLFIKNEFRIFTSMALPCFIAWSVLTFTVSSDLYIALALIMFIIITSHTMAITVPVVLTFTRKSQPQRKSSAIVAIEDSKQSLASSPGGVDPFLLVVNHPTLIASFERFCVQSLCVET